MNHHSSIGKLLLNAWSAEYALGIFDGVNVDGLNVNNPSTRDYLLQWTLPQAYYATLFSVRALLLARGTETITTSEADLFRQVDNLIDAGYYDHNGVWRSSEGDNFLRVLSTVRNHQACKSSLTDLQELQRNAVKQINFLLGWHERKIADLLGYGEYAQIILTLPAHLKTAPLATRWLDMVEKITF